MRFLRLCICSFLLCMYSLASGTTTIRVLTSYDVNVVSAWGVGNINARINLQIINLNTAFANSGIDVVAQSVGVVPFDSTGVTSIFDMAAAGQQSTQLRLRRDAAAADVVMMLGFYGVAAGRSLEIGATANTAFAAVDISDLTNYGYIHEFGHLLGARHQYTGGQPGVDGLPSNDTTGGPAAGTPHGAYIQVAGTDPGAAGGSSIICLHTVMAYPPINNLTGISCTSTRIPWVSTPTGATDYYGPGSGSVIWHITNPSFGGDSRNSTFSRYDNAAVIRAIAPAVAAYHNIKLASGVLGTISSVFQSILMIDP